MKNFDYSRKGEMLNNLYDFESDLGIAYQRCIDFKKDFHSLDRMVICFPRGATVAISEGRDGQKTINDNSNVIIKKANYDHKVWSQTKVYDDLALLPTSKFVEKIVKNYGFSKDDFKKFSNHVGVIKRSSWLDSIIQQFFLRRVMYKENPQKLAFFQEEILREVITIFLGESSENQNIDPNSHSKSFSDIIDLIESNLFNQVDIQFISRNVGTSPSSLNRLFKSQINLSPKQYIQKRRLEEAMKLVKDSTHTIQEVSYLVGYESSASFIRAFKKEFNGPPNSFRSSGD